MGNRNDLHYPSEYNAWKNMKRRCDNPNHPSYHYYGARGISYVVEWFDFEAFLADMGPCPSGLTLERRDNNQGYSKSNCFWAPWSVQSLNKRKRSDNASGVVGVSYCNTYKIWRAHAKTGGRQQSLYRGVSFFEAVCARKSWDANHSPLANL